MNMKVGYAKNIPNLVIINFALTNKIFELSKHLYTHLSISFKYIEYLNKFDQTIKIAQNICTHQYSRLLGVIARHCMKLTSISTQTSSLLLPEAWPVTVGKFGTF